MKMSYLQSVALSITVCLSVCVCVCVCRMGRAERRADDKVNRFVSALPEFALCVC